MLEDAVKSMAQLIFRAVETPVGRECCKVLETNDAAGFGRITVDPGGYADAESYFKDVQCVSLLKKFDDGDVARREELEAKARQTFQDCELQCAYTNRRLADFIYNTAFYDGKDERLWRYLHKVKRLLRTWLGCVPSELETPIFGKGATVSDRGRLITIMDKMSSQPTMTRDADICIPFWTRTMWFRALVSEFPHKSEPSVVLGNRFATVPKDCRKRRCIAIEPSLNITYQLCVGKVLRKRLKRVGIDLDEGQVLHRQLAREASITGAYATLDLSNASDTICNNLVKALLPPMWYELLNSLRSHYTQVDGKWYKLEKFSSMGNGFTFELETLLFLALLAGLDERLQPGENLFVYGDDIIIDSQFSTGAVGVLTWAGFSLNKEKSFAQGAFRESCGGDYFDGRAVRPFHLEEAPSLPTDWIAMANKIYSTAVETYWCGDYELCQELRTSDVLGWLTPAWSHCISQLPNEYRKLRGPYGRLVNGELKLAGDGWIYDSREKWIQNSISGIRYFKRLLLRAKHVRSLKRYPGSVALAALVYGVPSRGMSPKGAPNEVYCKEVPFS